MSAMRGRHGGVARTVAFVAAAACLVGAASCTAILGISDPVDEGALSNDGAIDEGTLDALPSDSRIEDTRSSETPTDSFATTPPDGAPETTTLDTAAESLPDTTSIDTSVCATAADGTPCGTSYCAPMVCESHACVAGTTPCGAPSVSCKSVSCDESSRTCPETLIDADGDGQGPASMPAAAPCDDCDDSDPHVFTGQTAWFVVPRASGGFDYDCSGGEEMEFSVTGECLLDTVSGGCTFKPGWAVAPPACGVASDWLTSCIYRSTSTTCDPSVVSKTQACH